MKIYKMSNNKLSGGKKAKLFLAFLVVLFAVLQIVNIHLSNSISTNSIYAANDKAKVEDLSEKNTLLKTEVLKYTSYDYVASKAGEIGFVENNKNTISLSGPKSFAQR